MSAGRKRVWSQVDINSGMSSLSGLSVVPTSVKRGPGRNFPSWSRKEVLPQGPGKKYKDEGDLDSRKQRLARPFERDIHTFVNMISDRSRKLNGKTWPLFRRAGVSTNQSITCRKELWVKIGWKVLIFGQARQLVDPIVHHLRVGCAV